MKKSFTLILAFLFFGILSVTAQASLEGSVIDKDKGTPLDFAYVKLYKDSTLITGTQTDLDGNFLITNIDPGTYDVEASFVSYTSERKTGVVMKAGKVLRLKFELSIEGKVLKTVVITEYKAPLIDIDNTTTGGTVTAEKIQNLPTKDVTAIAATTAGVSTIDGGSVSIRGGRTNATAYYVDGIRVIGLVPQSDIEQMQVITGGLAAKYGDATGGLISITTKGPSQRFSGGAELETSQYLDPYGYNLASGYLSGPILKKKGRTVLGFRLSGQYKYLKDDNPSAVGLYRMPESVISELEQKPIVKYKKTIVPSGLFLSNDDIGGKINSAPNEDNTSLDLNGKLDTRFSKNIDVSLSGSYHKGKNRFTPSTSWGLLNYTNNPYFNSSRYRFNVRLRHKIGKQGYNVNNNESEKKSGTMVRNAYYTIRAGYEIYEGTTHDYRHGDKFSRYGYFGSQDMTLLPAFNIVDTATWHGPGIIWINNQPWDFVGYSQSFSPFKANDEINPALSRYNDQNGRINSNFNVIWDDLYSNVGQVYNRSSKSESERYSINISTGFDFLPNGSKKGRHSIELGFVGEMRVNRYWNIAPLALWELAREQQNIWIVGVDTTDVIGTVSTSIGGDTYEFLKYNTKLNRNEDSRFYKKVREFLGKNEHDYVNVDGELGPDDLRLDMFSGKEVNDKGLLYYYGYDYLGNKLNTDVKFKDFFSGQGRKDFWSPAYNPLYGGIFIQDKFSFKDIIMRIGARVDYFDANTKVLKDPYSLYEIETAKDFYASHPEKIRPESVGDDYKVYVAEEGSDKVIGYRKGDQWYQTNGTATSGSLIFKGGLVTPYYKERTDSLRNIQSKYYNPDISFEDYTPQVNFMPRIAFSFPISDNAGFFAHYDVLVQRPSAGNVIMTPIQYYYFESTNNATYNNPNLKPEKTIDYEVGFQQKLTNNSALKIQAYYREQRDMIRIRPYIFVPGISRYNSYGNLDYGTVKGFSFTYDFRRKGNLEFQLAYTLQFAFGTGSNANSAAGLSNRGIIRNLYPTNTDERHRLSLVVDYRYFSGKLYNGPELFGFRIFENAGVNIQTNAVSGRPYTKASQPVAFGGSGYIGAINGARKPWYFEVSLKADKSFKIKNKLRANVYLRIENLLNTKNVLGVYSYTGDPADDGYLLSQFGQNRISKIIDQGKPLDNFYDMYSWRMLAPGHYSRPRRIYLGLMFNL